PGATPPDRAQVSSSALKGRRGLLRPFRAHYYPLIPKPRALPWASMRRRLQHRKLRWVQVRRGRSRSIRPLPFMTRPVGGKPGHAALMYLLQHWFHKKVARTIKNIRDIHGLHYFAG